MNINKKPKLLITVTISLVLLSACNNSNSSEKKHCRDYQRNPVLFVHGSGLSSSSWDAMISAFLKNGYPRRYLSTIDLLPRDGDNIKAAAFIAKKSRQLIQQSHGDYKQQNCHGSPPNKIAIVAHSMGAISSRWYANKIAPEKVAILITLAGANHGTNALCGRPGEGDQQMCPAFAPDASANKLQVQLNGTLQNPLDETPYGVGRDPATVNPQAPDATRKIVYYSIRLEPDRWITPSNSAVLDGAGGLKLDFNSYPVKQTSEGNLVFNASTSHDELPTNRKLIDLVYHILNTAPTPTSRTIMK